MSYLKKHGNRQTPQRERALGRSDQIENSEGGYVFDPGMWQRLRRFLILGSEGGSYYANERKLTRENIDVVVACIREDGVRVVQEIEKVSGGGLAPKNDQALFALAAVFAYGDPEAKVLAESALPRVARTSTHLFQFVAFVRQFRGWGRSLRRAVAKWYAQKTPEQLSYQVVKYREREKMNHRDLLRLSHPGRQVTSGNPAYELTPEQEAVFAYAAGKSTVPPTPIIEGYERAQHAQTTEQTAGLIREYGLTREMVKTEHLRAPEVWNALLVDMPMTAMIRNLPTMTRVGLLTPQAYATQVVIERLIDQERLRKARIHPLQVLLALVTYQEGRGFRSSATWQPVRQIVDALDQSFYEAFGAVEPAGKRTLIGLDVSSSMQSRIAGTFLPASVAATAMSLVTVATEPMTEVMAFTGRYGRSQQNVGEMTQLTISPHQRLDDVVKMAYALGFGATDCALPILYAFHYNREIDTFIIYTDNETWAGQIQPFEALQRYREKTGIPAKLVVVGMVSNGFSIADPNDPGMLDVVGFDTSAPNIIGAFSRGEL